MKSKMMTTLAATAALGIAGCSTAMNDDMSAGVQTGVQASAQTSSSASPSSRSVRVGGQPMYANRTIAANAVNAPNLSQLVSLVQRAGLVETLSGPGPFTVFAPNNDAFTRVPAETMGRLSDNAVLTRALTYHVVPGRMTRADIIAAIRAGGGTARLTTVNGNPLSARMQGRNVVLEGNNGSIAYIQTRDVPASNGIVHVINGVLIPPSLG